MKLEKFNQRDTRFAPWTALCLLSLLAAMVFAVPSVGFAQITGELSQECNSALIGTEHTLTATVTDDGAPGANVTVFFYSTDPENYGKYMSVASFDNGIATFPSDPLDPTVPPYTVDSVGKVEITLYYVDVASNYTWV